MSEIEPRRPRLEPAEILLPEPPLVDPELPRRRLLWTALAFIGLGLVTLMMLLGPGSFGGGSVSASVSLRHGALSVTNTSEHTLTAVSVRVGPSLTDSGHEALIDRLRPGETHTIPDALLNNDETDTTPRMVFLTCETTAGYRYGWWLGFVD